MGAFRKNTNKQLENNVYITKTLDVTDCIPMAQEDKEKTSFSTPFGSFQFRM